MKRFLGLFLLALAAIFASTGLMNMVHEYTHSQSDEKIIHLIESIVGTILFTGIPLFFGVKIVRQEDKKRIERMKIEKMGFTEDDLNP